MIAGGAAASTAIIIVSYRTGPSLFSAIRSALAATDVAAVVVVDNGNPDADAAALDARAASEPRLTLIRGQGNVGFARACNLGAVAAGAAPFGAPSRLLFLNPDAEIASDVPGLLAAAGDARRRPWIAGGRIERPDGGEQRGGRRRAPTLSRAVGALLGGGADRMHLEGAPDPDGPVAVDAVSGACLMMRADDYAALGGFDERYFLHVEDLDLCARALEAGGEVVFVPAARVRHVGGTSDAPSLFVEWCKGRGLARYLVRFARGPVERGVAVLAGPFVVAAALARAFLRPSRRARRASA